jgi:RNA polymerase sigma-70 factor, ECF subfamily
MRLGRRLHAVPDSGSSTPEDLLVRVGRGDREAFAALYDLVAATVYGLARRVVRDPQLAEDIAQEALVEVWRLAPQFDPTKGKAMSWIATIAHRRAIDRVRSEQSRRDREDRVAVAERTDTLGDDVSAGLMREATRASVTSCLSCLTETQREVIQLAFYDGRTYVEVAELLGIPLGTAKTRIRDGLIKLRDAVALAEGLS